MAGETYQFKGQTAQWGTTSTHSSGVVTDENLKKTASTEPVENNQGAMVGMCVYDEMWSGSLSIVAAQNATLPAPGDTVTILECTLLITDVENVGTHKGKRKFNISATGGKNLTLA